MKKILLLIILFKSLTFAVDEKYEQLAQQSNTCAAYFGVASECFKNKPGAEELSMQLYETFIDYLKISEYYYKKSIPTRSNEIIRKLTTLNVTEEIEKMGNSIEHNCGNISVIRIENNDTCILFYKEKIEKIRK